MTNELVLSTKDLTDVGINSQITSNDLVEVVAHDIYDKYLDSINDVIKRGEKLEQQYSKLLDAELGKMKKALSKYLSGNEKISVVNEEDIEDDDEMAEENDISASFGTADHYWPYISISKVVIRERDKGTVIDKQVSNKNIPPLKTKSVKVCLTITTQTRQTTTPVKVGAITGEIKESISKKFNQTVTIPITRFKQYANEIYAYNKEVAALLEFLPKNGALSVERFTREARVKMNKKIISNQSPDFRKKISQLFNIKL